MTTPSPSKLHQDDEINETVAAKEAAADVRLTLKVDNTSALPIFLRGRVSASVMCQTFFVCVRGGCHIYLGFRYYCSIQKHFTHLLF